MAEYGLRYFKELTHDDGTVVRLEIHKKIVGVDLMYQSEIGGVVQGLSLQIQGQQGDIDTPIVKTSLSMTFVDAPDLIDWRKTGDWEEFYTADATMWKVIVMVNGTAIWGGYITPDSFSEDLVYHGSVNIVARDNIGHLQDFEFDAPGDGDGMISLYDLVLVGWSKIESPMTLDWFGDGNGVEWLMCEGKPMYDTRMNVSFFEGMNWYEAIEKALYSYGLVMRYVGRNRVHICPLKDMPKHGYHDYDYFGTIEPKFITGARRELVPAVKEIAERVEYDINEDFQPGIKAVDFLGQSFDAETPWGVVEGIAWPLVVTSPMFNFGWYNEVTFKTLAFNPSAYSIDNNLSNDDVDNIRTNTCILTGTKDDDTHSLSYVMTVAPEDYAINISFGKWIARLTRANGEHFVGYPLSQPNSEYTVKFAIKAVNNGITYYLTSNGEWVDNKVSQTMVVSGDKMTINIPLSGVFDGKVALSVVFLNINTNEDALRIKQILSIALSRLSNKPMLENNSVTTKYEESNNVIISRNPELGPAYNSVALPQFIKNGIFVSDGLLNIPALDWSYNGADTLELAVHIHKQLLCYYHKPNNLITGTLVNMGSLFPGCNVIWREREHMLISGTLNLLTLQVESAVLREFVRYDDMWKDNGVELVSVEHKASMTR